MFGLLGCGGDDVLLGFHVVALCLTAVGLCQLVKHPALGAVHGRKGVRTPRLFGLWEK